MRSHLRETRARILLENFRMFHSHMTPFSHVRFSTLFFLFSVSSCASVYFLLFFCLSLIPPHPTFLMDSFSLFNGLYHPSFPLLPFSSYRFIAPSPPSVFLFPFHLSSFHESGSTHNGEPEAEPMESCWRCLQRCHPLLSSSSP